MGSGATAEAGDLAGRARRIHFLPLAWVFAQPIFVVAGVLITAAAVVAARVKDEKAARSFWCGILGGPILLGVGTICAIPAFGAL